MSNRARIRLVVVGMANSPHLHRWVNMVARPDVAILVFSSLSFPIHIPAGFQSVDLNDVTTDMPPGMYLLSHLDSRREGDQAEDRRWNFQPFTHSFVPVELLSTPAALSRCLSRFCPDLLHSMETQVAGYLCAETARRQPLFPPWIHSTWGSDLSLFRKLPGHPERLRKVFTRVQVHLADCACDRPLARQFGYGGPDMPIIPSSGGMDIEGFDDYGYPSKRKRIVIKGYHNWAGRAMLILSAIILARAELEGFSIDIVAATPRVKEWAQRMRDTLAIDIQALDYMAEHKDAVRRLAAARLVVGISISDGLSTTVLEAMSVGTFPVQSSPGCSHEWFRDGRTGIIVSPSNTRAIADAIIRAATDDELVNTAARENLEVVRCRWSVPANRLLAWRVYDQILNPPAAMVRVGNLPLS
jgi:glycosyltransferase involved in cell wall biosynthesis